MKPMRRIKINDRYYDIAIVGIRYKIDTINHYCGYVILSQLPPDFDYDNLSCCTFKDGNVFGVDTNHIWNLDQTLEEKEEDCIRQIKDLIYDYNKQMIEIIEGIR